MGIYLLYLINLVSAHLPATGWMLHSGANWKRYQLSDSNKSIDIQLSEHNLFIE